MSEDIQNSKDIRPPAAMPRDATAHSSVDVEEERALQVRPDDLRKFDWRAHLHFGPAA
jgi:hypothetical protein